PAGTLSYTLTVFDPDAPTGTGFWHWVVFNIPAATTSLAAGFGTTAPPAPIVEGYTDNGSSGYGGPCPPVGDGPHRYIFTVSALNVAAVPGGATSATTGAGLTFRTRGTILAQGTLIGTFSR
ncbi:MAG: YbhB/YbcL family Raf kinase inhibitor-like protein, partial [Candidatus Velthaea sp.]